MTMYRRRSTVPVMTRDRKLHIVAISLLVAAIVVGGISYLVRGAAFWALIGLAVVCLIVGMHFASRAGAEQKKRENADL